MNPIDQAIADVKAKVEAENTIIDGAIVFVKSVPGLVQTAYQKGLDAGATPAQLQALADLSAGLTSKAQEITDALVAGTPTPTLAAAKKAK